MVAPRPASQPAIMPARAQKPVVVPSDNSVATVPSPNRTVETIRAHGRPALHFLAIQSHSRTGTTMLPKAMGTPRTMANPTSAPASEMLEAPPGPAPIGLQRPAFTTSEITPTIPLIA
jgi:hypothetical protein